MRFSVASFFVAKFGQGPEANVEESNQQTGRGRKREASSQEDWGARRRLSACGAMSAWGAWDSSRRDSCYVIHNA
jgi:hypothetical protein